MSILKSDTIKKYFIDLTFNHFPSIYRPKSDPVISSDTFRCLADHVFDETSTINPIKVQKNEIVFVKGTLIKIFFNYFHPKIINKYILIIHNSSDEVDSTIYKFLDDKIIHCFAKNLNTKSSDRISAIPVGFKDKRFFDIKYYRKIYKLYNEKSIKPKEKKILANFNYHTNFDRINLINIIKKIDFIDIQPNLNFESYFDNLSKYKYSLCPRGSSLDSFRIWESILTNTIPITLKTPFSENLKQIGTPIITLSDWNQLFDLEYLEKEFIKLPKFNYLDLISSRYWKNKIFEKKL